MRSFLLLVFFLSLFAGLLLVIGEAQLHRPNLITQDLDLRP